VYCVSRLRNCIRVRFECPRNFIVDRAKSRILFPAARARAITSERASERERADTRPRARYRAETELSMESSRVFHGGAAKHSDNYETLLFSLSHLFPSLLGYLSQAFVWRALDNAQRPLSLLLSLPLYLS